MSDSGDKGLKEKLAAIEHERWADWQEWCHEVLRNNLPVEAIPAVEKILERWDKQIATPYSELSDKEKASDMEQVDRYWPLIEAYIASKLAEAERLAREDELKKINHNYTLG